MKISKIFIWLLLELSFIGVSIQSFAQSLQGRPLTDSLITELPKTKSDTSHINIMISIARSLLATDPATSMKYADSAMQLSQQNKWKKGIALAYLYKARSYRTTSNYVAGLENANKSFAIFDSLHWKKGMGDSYSEVANNYERLGNYSEAIKNNFKAISIYEELGIDLNIGLMYNNIGNNYFALNNYINALENYNKCMVYFKKTGNKFGIASALDNMASVYREQGITEKVNEYNLRAIQLFEEIDDKPALGRIYNNRGNILAEQKNFDSALIYYKKAINIAESFNIKSTLTNSYYGIGGIYFILAKNGPSNYVIPAALKTTKETLLNNAFSYYTRSLALSEQMGDLSLLLSCTKSLSETEALRGNYKSALSFYTKSNLYKDSIFNDENKTKIATLENQRLAEVKNKEIQLLNKEYALQAAEAKRVYSILGIVVLAVITVALIQYRSNKHKQEANQLLQHQKEKVESTLSELKSTQAQLIQSEKMASLGELTAGIAHEIQNPLNFVNNFSEMNKEMLEELKAERLKPKAERDGKLEDEILNDVIGNEEKINHHGKRADAIVKGMLQHSRQTKGMREPTDINALCDEFLKLSYHGLRAKDKNFNADFKTDFDESIGRINIVPQDIGRVLLNLFNNAFYAVKRPNPLKGEYYKPLVMVTTKKINSPSGEGGIEITVTDNGNGIPEKILGKIFQPFFTTKPPGEGTGLGLSLSYDIIKVHNGTIEVESKPGEGTAFVIQLPV